ADVEGAPAGPGFPGPTRSLTKHRSACAVNGLLGMIPPESNASPFLNDFTSKTLVKASGLNASFMLSSQLRATGSEGGIVFLPPSPHACRTHTPRTDIIRTADPMGQLSNLRLIFISVFLLFFRYSNAALCENRHNFRMLYA